ncbi:multicopper oxidase domain-containing protein [Bdellovibrio sp. HCB209]|uniref:multicopper oxidase domain-containing protein n=1 Tax=Bdellovibrio sp. HCB209 TaxID=3394354 RepID=UPI0039B63887
MKQNILKTIVSLSVFLLTLSSYAKTVRYELTIAQQKVNITGKEVDWAITVNGGIPAPTLEFTEGDDAEITVINKLDKEEASVHWHGILLPPEEDGVAYLNTPPIFAGKSRTFKFKIRQHGTYWYHSHTMLQEQKGVFGAFIIHPKKETIKADKEAVVVISDWSDENADQIMKNLRKDGDYYLYKKNSIRSIFGAAKAGGLKTYYSNELSRMGGMDLSDVGYDAFLINGKKDSQLLMAHPGETVRLRIINAGASSYFYVSLGDVPMTVVSADGIDIEPIYAKELLMGMAETYDVLFTVPEHKNYELRATAQDVTGYASAWIGMGEKVPAPSKVVPDLYAPMNHGDHGAHAGHGSHTGHSAAQATEVDHSAHGDSHSEHNHGAHHGHSMPAVEKPKDVVETLTVDKLKAKESTVLPKNAKVTELKLVLGGDMERYVWHINGKAIHEDKNIMVKEGDVVRFTFVNETMMHHPMHLHGHFFRVINENGDKSPLKHTVDVEPMGARTIEFYANEPGQWMLHCHNLYHMKSGMARVIKYESFKPSPEMAHWEHHDPHGHDHWYQTGSLQAATNVIEGKYKLMQTWNEFEVRAESRKDEDWHGEGDFFYRRWKDNYLNFVLGAAAVDDDYRGVVGVGYLLPLLVETNLLVDHKGKLRVDLEKRFQWISTVYSDIEYRWRQDEELDSELGVSLMYAKSWKWAAGIRYTGKSFGVGLQYQF